VVDLRNNPGGIFDQAVSVSDSFLKTGVIVSTKGRRKYTEKIYTAEDDGTEPECPIIILINGGSASASEIVSGALHDNGRALLLGTRTFGKGVMQIIIPLKDGAAVKLTTAKYYTPSGESIQAKGIKPDITVEYVKAAPAEKNSRKEIREKDLEGHIEGDLKPETKAETQKEPETDNQLQRALDLIRGWELLEKMNRG